MIDIDELGALAKAVVAGPAAQKHPDPVMKNMGRLEFAEICKAYSIALSPANVFALIAEVRALRDGLQRIANIEDKTVGGDWDEIEEARQIAQKVLGRQK